MNQIGQGGVEYLTEDLKLVYVENERHTDSGYLVYKGIECHDFPFRKGGLFNNKFKDGENYCMMIAYPEKPDGWGNHCIINREGEICYIEEKWTSSHSYFLKGVLATTKDGIFNLETQEIICPEGRSSSVKSDEFLFVEHSYSWKDKDKKFLTGVYKIRYSNGEVELFPNVEEHARDKANEEARVKREEEWAKQEAERKTKKKEEDKFKDVGRNDQCLCGSGKKYKKCCLGK